MPLHNIPDSIYPLYDARWEHDSCGTGFVAEISGDASHLLIQTALQALAHLTHRGAQDADAETSDGAGLLTQIPRTLLCEELQTQQAPISNPEDLALGMFFLPDHAYVESRQIIEQVLKEAGLAGAQSSLLHFRDPPIDYTVLRARALSTAPRISPGPLTRPLD